MKTVAASVVFALAILCIAQQARAWPGERRVDTKTYSSNADATVAVRDASGDVTVTGWDQDRIEVTTTRSAWSADDLNRLDTRVDSHADRFSVVTEYPNLCFSCDISLRLRVPARAHVTIETSSG